MAGAGLYVFVAVIGMAKQWAKIYRNVKDSDRLTALLNRNPLAEALYWRIKAHADDFGRFVADPAEVGAAVCPRNLIGGSLTVPKVAKALDDMAACGLITFYEVGGKRYLEIVDYFNHAHENWSNISRPEYPAPEGWTPPETLVQFLIQNAKSRNVSPERYGVSIECWPKGIEYPFNTHSIPIEYPSNTLGDTLGIDLRLKTLDIDSEEDKGVSRARAREAHRLEADDDPPGPDPINNPLVGAALAYFWRCNPPIISQREAQEWALNMSRLLGGTNAVSEKQVIDALNREPGALSPPDTAAQEHRFPDRYLNRLSRELGDSANGGGKRRRGPATIEQLEALKAQIAAASS